MFHVLPQAVVNPMYRLQMISPGIPQVLQQTIYYVETRRQEGLRATGDESAGEDSEAEPSNRG